MGSACSLIIALSNSSEIDCDLASRKGTSRSSDLYCLILCSIGVACRRGSYLDRSEAKVKEVAFRTLPVRATQIASSAIYAADDFRSSELWPRGEAPDC